MHRRFAVVLRLVLLVILLMGMLGQPQPVQAAEVERVTGGISAIVTGSLPDISDGSPASNAPEPDAVQDSAAALIGGPIAVSAQDTSLDITSANQSGERNANLIGIDPYTLPPYPTSSFNGGLTITPITAYNLVVDSNVLSPSSYGPSAATLGAQFCNTSGSALTNVWAYVGDYNADNDATPGEAGDLTPGTYPVHNQTTDPTFNATFPHLATPPTQVDYGDPTRFYALEQESGSSSDSVDASRYIGALAAGECRTEYWLVSYPRKALIGGSWVDVTGGVKPEDDLWLSYFFWGTSGATSSNRSYIWNPVTMRNEISAMANKIWPNGDNKVPDQYIQAIQQILGWDTWTPNGSGSTAYPGETVVSQGIWYDLGNVGAGFDNNGDFVPDRNAWVQPIGDSAAYDPGCFRLVRTYGLVIVKLTDGSELLIPFVDQTYFENIPDNNNGAVGLVFYEYVALDGACTAGLTPYQEVASGYDNEKFNADFGAGIPPLQSQQTNMTFDKNGQTSIGLGGRIDYTLTFTLPDVNPTDSMVIIVGNPSVDMPLTYYETVPSGLQYVGGSASANVTMTNYSVGTVSATRLWSTDSGATWTTTDPGTVMSTAPNNLVILQWQLEQSITSPATGSAVTGQVSFSANVPITYTPTVVNNTSCLKLGSADCFVEDTHTTLVTGTGRIEGTVWRDDATGSGILGNGILDETGAGINAVTVNLYWDANGDGDHMDAGDFLYTTTTSNASGDYAFTNLPATSGSARFLIDVNDRDSNIPSGYGPTTATSYTRISLAAGDIYGDAANEPSDFGFAPALDVDKRVDTTGTIMEGDTIQYTIAVSNTLPGNGTNGASCVYSRYANTEGSISTGVAAYSKRFDDNLPLTPSTSLNVFSGIQPDGKYATADYRAAGTQIISGTGIVFGPQSGSITNVKIRVRYYMDYALVDDYGGLQYWSGTTPTLYASTPIGTVAQQTAARTALNVHVGQANAGWLELDLGATNPATGAAWTWNDFAAGNTIQIVYESGKTGSGDNVYILMDAMSMQITTNAVCGDASGVLNPVPLTDTFDDTYFDFISANPPVSSSGTGTLTWNNVGPLYPGQTRYITVYLRAALAGNSPSTINTATSTNSKFADGLPANSPESSTASVTIVASANTRTFSGTVFDDNSSPLNGWSGAAWTRAGTETGYDSLGTVDLVIPYIPVDLYACFDASTGLLVSTNTNSPCATAATGNDGEWRLVRTTSTNASGQYSFGNLAAGFYYSQVNYSLIVGNQVADVNMSGVCSTCDSRSNNPSIDNVNASFIGNLVGGNTSVTRVNFGYNVPAGSYNIGDFFFYDWDGDGVQDASDEPMPGVTVRLLAADGTPLGTTTTASDGTYLFSGRPVGYYTVQVDTSTLPVAVVQSKDPDSTMDNQSTFALIANDLTRDFAYQPTGSGTIGDTVWKDTNGDGLQSSSEPGIAGVTVALQVDRNGDGTYVTIATAVTDANGKYLFKDLPQGTYRVALERNGNSAAIPNDAFGNDYLPSTGTLSGSFVYRTATLPTSTSSDLSADFGFAPPASIGDTVYYDINGNGTQDFTEAGINGVTVTLYTFTDANSNHRYDPGEALSALVASATTATVNGKTGFYQFTGLTPGNYVVQVTPPAGMTLTGDPNTDGFACPDLHDPADPGEPSSVVCDSRDGMHLYNGTNYTGADFGYQPVGVIGDTLWIDTDADGVRDSNEQGIADVTVRLCADEACASAMQVTTTDADGHYLFTNTFSGTYYVVVETSDADFPTGLTATYNDPDDTTVNNFTRVVLSGGVVTAVGDDADPTCTNCGLDVDFGYRYVGVRDLSGTICLENASVNGVCGTTGSGVGANESAYANTVVYLYVWNDDGDGLVEANEVTQIASTQTNASGDYSFENIPDGVYYVIALGAPQDDIDLTTTQASVGAPTTQVHETTDANGDTVSAYQVIQVNGSDVQNRDFAFESGPLDYGDLPSTYSTQLNDSPAGPSHTVSAGLYLGATAPDTETNGAPTFDATGDGADEDGVSLVGVWGNGAYNAVNGTGGAVSVTVNGSGTLMGWIDFNRDGDFTDAGEMLIHQAVSTGTANYTFDIPANTFAGPGDPASLTLYARFRLFDAEPLFPSLAYAGAAGNGEVEDYAFTWSMTVDKDTTTPTVSPTGTVTYTVALVNTGDATLSNIQATDILPDFNGAAAGKGYTVTNVAATGGLAVNFPGFDGDTDPNLLAAGNSLAAGASRTITIALTLNGAVANTYDNTAAASSTETGSIDDDGTIAQDADTPVGSDPEADEDVTVSSTGTLVIVKNTIPDDAQDFAYTVSGTGLAPFTLDDDTDATLSNTQTFNNLSAGGTYAVTETAIAGWSVTNISCTGATSSTVTIGAAGGFDAGDTAVSVVLAGGETVTCTFENTAILSVVTTKTADDTSIPATGQSVTYIVEVQNTSRVEVTLDSLTDDLFNDITTTGHDNVTATTCATGVVLAPGATYTCSFAATVSGTFPGAHVNTVTAQVRNGSNTASDTDDATVTFEETSPELTVVKSSSAGGTVHPGDTITYTINITNSGNVPQNNIVISDAQPAGTTYVSFSSLANGYSIGNARTYLDQFGVAQFNNSNGTAAWGGTPWTETGDNGIANSGKIQINTSTAFVADFQATAPADVLTLTRPVNLANAASATLTYSIAENGTNSAADTALVQIWNGTVWTTVATYTGDFTSATGNVNILAYANAGTQIRFVVTGFDGAAQNLVLDNVQVQFTAATAIAKDNDPFGGVPGSLINGSPPTLLFSGDSFDLLPGQSMTFSYQATVNNPVPAGQTQVVNTASVTSVEIVTPVQATVTDTILNGSITIIKDSLPNDAQDFAFTAAAPLTAFSLDDDADGTLPNTQTFTGLTAGSYSVAETSAAGWSLTNIVCSGATLSVVNIGTDADFDAGDTNVSVNLAAGENITCTFTNTRLTTLTLRKTWVNAINNNAVVVTARSGGVLIDSLASVANTQNETDTDPTPVDVTAGQVLTFNETFTTGAAFTYVSGMTCTGAADTNLADGLTVDPTDTAIVCTETNKNFSPAKFVVGSSEQYGFDSDVLIGEIVRYRLSVYLPEGTTTNLRFLDHIVDNMAYMNDGTTRVAFVCNSGAGCISSSDPGLGTGPIITGTSRSVTPTFTLPAANISGGSGSPYGDGVDPTFSLGNITNNDTDADAEWVVLEFNALVLNTAANVDGALRGNTFDVLVENSTVMTSGSVLVTIREPALTISKAVVTPPSDAGDPIVYELTVRNMGNAPAYDISITDILDAALTGPVVVSGSTIGGFCGSIPNSVSGSFASPVVSITVTCLNMGGSATITVSAYAADADVAGLTFPNSASLTYTSLPGTGTPLGPDNSTGSTTPGASGTVNGERNGSGGIGTLNDYVATSNIVSTTLATPLIDKLDPVATATIGETITYNICVTLPEGQTQGLVVTDAIPAGLAALSYSVSNAANGVCPGATAAYNGDAGSVAVTSVPKLFPGADGQDLELGFDTITTNADNNAGNNTFLIQVPVRVLNIVGNQEGNTLGNTASLTYTDPNDGSTDSATDPTVPAATTIVEPTLNVTKSASTLTPAPGPLTFTLTIAHTAASDVPAYDTTITDTLPVGLSGLTNVNVSSPASCATGIVNNSTASALNITIGTIPLGCIVTVTYDVTVSGSNGDTRTNDVDMTWTSLPGTVAGERTGADGVGGALNDYADTAAVTVTVNVLNNAVISDRIWSDVDGDGIQDAGESSLGAGIRVYLDSNNNNVYDAGESSDTTDASGIYAISALAAGTYNVRVDTTTLPAGYVPTYDLDGGTDNEASVTLLAGQTRTDVDFGYQQLATIGNFVWHDLDADGIQDGGETGIAGATVNLLDSLGNPVGTTLTNASGIYSFTVRPGSYILAFVTPAGYLRSLQDQGVDDTLDSDASIPTGRTAVVTVAAGETNNTIDAGMYRLGTIAGQVRYDVDNDGNPADGDSGIDTVTVELRTDPNGDGNPADGVLVTSTTTNGTGNYTFTNVPPGNYVVVETNLAGYASTHDLDGATGNTLDQIGITLSSGQNSTGNDFLDTFLYSISGQVRYDVDNDGNLGDAESGLAGANIGLWTDPNGDGDPADGAQVGVTITTGATGNYTFGNLTPGNYVVVEVNPAGYTSTADRVVPNNDRIPLALTNANSTGNDFLDALRMNISGQVRYDVDNDEDLSDADSGLENAQIRLYTDPNGDGDPSDGISIAAPAITSGLGTYMFSNLPPGHYVVVETNPAGYTSTADSSAPNNDWIPVVLVATDSTGNDFLDTLLYSISGQVRYDIDVDGSLADADSGLANANVSLFTDPNGDGDPADGTQVGTTITTGATGNYSFPNVIPGNYVVVEVNPAGYTSTADSAAPNNDRIPVAITNAASIGNNFLDTNMAILGDYVWEDASGNGLQDAGEPGLAGITVRLLDGGGTLVATTTTNASGLYSFTVPAGTYRVDFDLPVGYIFTLVNQGGNDAIDSDADRTTGETANYTLVPGETNNTIDAGMAWTSAIGNFVWNDLDADGVQDPGENGIDGVTVDVYRSGDALPTATQTTAGGGGYFFGLLTPGDYYLHFTLPGGYVFTTQDAAAATDATDSDVNTGTGNTAATILLAAEYDDTWDAGMYWPVDLRVTKTDGVTTYIPNGSLTYTIRVSNTGPSDAIDASFTDNRPADISSWNWTCAAAGSASCGSTTSGTDNISLNDIDLPADAGGATNYLTFTINATVSAGASGPLTNLATVTAPSGVRETDGTNNSASDTDTLANATLTLQKTVVNNNGGTAADTDWTLTATGPTTISGAERQPAITNAAVLTGTYTLSESGGPGGYTAGTWSCVGAADANPGDGLAIAPGENVTCTITNNDDPPSLTLVKTVTNDNGGTALPSAWTLTADGTGANDVSGPGPSVSSGATLQADTFTLSESGPAGYTASAWTCTNGVTVSGGQIALGLGQSTTCTITNNDNAPSLTLNKIVVNNNGGTAVESDWTLRATGPTTLTGAGASGGADVVSGAGFEAGTYTLSESGPAGYTASAWTCTNGVTVNGASQIALGLGQTTVCSITNDDTDLLPQADPDTNTAVENGPAVGGNVLTNETSLGNTPTTVTAASQGVNTITIGNPFATAAGGSLTLNANGTYSYTPPVWNLVPPAGLVEVFNYTITDVDGDPSSTTLTINVTNNNRTPVANNDTNTTTQDTPVPGNVTPNDVLSGDGGNTWNKLTNPANGTVVFNANGTYTYTPNPGYYGTDSFTYEICDVDHDCDPATVTITIQGDPRGLSKTVIDSNEPSTTDPDVAIGEIVTYEVRVTVPPGVFTNAQLVDTMERGLSYMDCVGITPNGMTTSNIDGFSAVCMDAAVDDAGGTTTVDVGRRVTFDFGTLTNGTATDQTLVVTYRAVVLDNAQNISGVNLDNRAEFLWNGGSLGPASETLVVAEPDVSIVKTASTTTVSVGSEITITLTIQHTANSETDAFDLVVMDDLPAELQYVPASLECTSGAQPANTCSEAGGIITAGWNNFTLAGGNGRVTFRVTVLSLPAGGIVNTATAAWTSLPGVPPSGPGILTPGQQNANIFSTERGYDPGDLINVYGANSALALGASGGGGGTGGKGGSSARKTLPATGFAPGEVTDLSNVPQETYTATNGVTVEIPSLGITLPIVGVPLKDGTWNVSWLGKQAGWLEGSAFPSWNGNSVLTSHVYLSNGLPGPFVNLSTLKYGDKIIVHSYGQKYIFEVRENLVVEPDDTSILRHETKPWLTLVTCKEYDEKTNTYRKRVVIRAVLVSVAWE